MPRRTRLKPWRGDRWQAVVYRAIERRVAGNIESIAAPLGIDDPSEREALVEAVTIELRRAWAYLRDVQSAASEAAARHILKELLRAKDLVMEVERADPTVRRLIEQHDPSIRGEGLLEEMANDPERLRKATEQALQTTTEVRQRGRPKYSTQISEYVLAEALAKIFRRFGGRPVRHMDDDTQEDGPFFEFVYAVMDIVPYYVERSLGRRYPFSRPIDYMIRQATQRERIPK
jgi:hypothetical protein